jgi:hypothetical protein
MTTNEMNITDESTFVEIVVGERELELTAVRNCLTIIDSTLKDIGSTNICSSADMTDRLLDLRNILKPLLN